MQRNTDHMNDPNRPVPLPQSESTDSAQSTEPRPARSGLGAALKFVGRFAGLDVDALGSSIAVWHRSADERWFAAEAAVAAAIQHTRRSVEQERLLEEMAEVFRRTKWFWAGEPGAAVGATEPSAQYVGTLAMLSLLVRDRLSPDQFELLYTPYAGIIPERELDPE